MFFGRAMMRMSIHTWPRDVDPYPIMRLMHGIFVFSGIVSLVTGVLGILAAVTLLRRDRSGRTLALVAAFLALISFPFGTALGIYSLIVLLRHGASENYERLSVPSA
jgi:ABC-type spermidine/putrescine transport system permease subunit I